MRRTWAALGCFLWLAIKPGPKVASLLTDLGVTAVGVLVAVKGHPAWENQPSSVTEIERGGTRRVLLAAVLSEPLAFWFYTSQAGHTGPGIVWFREAGVNDELTFPLEIVNTGDNDQTVRWNGRIVLPEHIDDATFELTRAA
jgi:hypothetical protein